MNRGTHIHSGLPDDLWCVVLQFAESWATFSALSQCSVVLYAEREALGRAHFATLTRSNVERHAVQQARSVRTAYAVMYNRCQLCGKPHRRGHVEPVWDIYAHAACVSAEVMSISRGVATYDLNYEQLCQLPAQNSMVWKYHGGRPDLPFGVLSTAQGLCLNAYRESLHDRRQRIEALRAEQAQRARDEAARNAEEARVRSALERRDDECDRAAKRRRIDELAPRKQAHLEPLLARYPELPSDLLETVRALYVNQLTLPLPWKRLEAVLDTWTYARFQVPDEKVRAEIPRRLVLQPSEFCAAYASHLK